MGFTKKYCFVSNYQIYFVVKTRYHWPHYFWGYKEDQIREKKLRQSCILKHEKKGLFILYRVYVLLTYKDNTGLYVVYCSEFIANL